MPIRSARTTYQVLKRLTITGILKIDVIKARSALAAGGSPSLCLGHNIKIFGGEWLEAAHRFYTRLLLFPLLLCVFEFCIPLCQVLFEKARRMVVNLEIILRSLFGGLLATILLISVCFIGKFAVQMWIKRAQRISPAHRLTIYLIFSRLSCVAFLLSLNLVHRIILLPRRLVRRLLHQSVKLIYRKLF